MSCLPFFRDFGSILITDEISAAGSRGLHYPVGHNYNITPANEWIPDKSYVDSVVGSGATFYQFTTGALTAGVTKPVSHNQELTNYIIIVRNEADTNNAMVQILQKTSGDPTNSIDIQSAIGILAPGLTVQIIGV